MEDYKAYPRTWFRVDPPDERMVILFKRMVVGSQAMAESLTEFQAKLSDLMASLLPPPPRNIRPWKMKR